MITLTTGAPGTGKTLFGVGLCLGSASAITNIPGFKDHPNVATFGAGAYIDSSAFAHALVVIDEARYTWSESDTLRILNDLLDSSIDDQRHVVLIAQAASQVPRSLLGKVTHRVHLSGRENGYSTITAFDAQDERQYGRYAPTDVRPFEFNPDHFHFANPSWRPVA